ncbi:MAG: amidohydrolase [Planctomycetota bacterium]
MTRPHAPRAATWLLCAAALALSACASAPVEPAAGTRLLIVNARVWSHPEADAVLVRGRRIAAIGRAADLQKEHGPGIDAHGGLLLPGLVDAHCHVLSGATSQRQLGLDGAKDLAAVQAALRRWAAEHPREPWLCGRGWTFDLVPDGKTPTRQQLDAVIDSRPVVLESYDGHALWVNTRALELAGVTAATVDPAAGQVVREADGKTPSGLLLEDAMPLVERALPKLDDVERRVRLRAGLQHLLELGLTGVDAICGDLDEAYAFVQLAKAGELPLRVTLWLPLAGDLDAYVKLRDDLPAHGLLRVGHLKGFLDGVIEAETAYMLAPYASPPGTTARGEPAIPPARLFELVKAAHARGLPVALHAIGDGAVRLALDAFAAAREAYPDQELRDRIEHIEVVHQEDLPRFRALDTVASMQPIHADPGAEPDEGTWSKNLGPARLERSFAWRALLDAKAVLAFGSDWPVMSANPLWGLAVATTRRSRQGLPKGGWNAHQAIGADEAVRAYTAGAAYAHGRERELGKLEPGQLADLVVLDPSVRLDQPAALWEGKPRLVVVDGVVRLGR